MNKYAKESLKYLLRSKPLIQKEIEHVEHLFSLSDKELEKYKERQFLTLFRRVYAKSPFYREFYSDHGIKSEDITTLDDVKKLPVLTKEIVKKNSGRMLTVPKWRVKTAHTSGTTGTPLTVYHSYKAIRLEQAYFWVQRKRYGFIFGEKVASLRGELTRDEFKLYVPVSNRLYLSSYTIKKENAERYYQELNSFQPKAIEGYPSSLYNLSLLFEEMGLTLQIPLAFTSSETLFPFQRERIEKVFHTEIFDHYGCTERTIFLSERRNHNGYKEAPGYSINEYKNDFILTTSLINQYFPLIRYQINDLVELDKKGGVKLIEGRKENNVICKDGTTIGRLDHIFKRVSGIKNTQIIQYKKGKININIVPDDDVLSNNIQQDIYRNAVNRFGENNMDITFNKINQNDIIYTSRGKYNLVISFL